MGFSKLLIFSVFISNACFAGDELADVRLKNALEIDSYSDGLRARLLEHERKYQQAMTLYLTGKGPYPAELAKKFADFEKERTRSLVEYSKKASEEEGALRAKQADLVGHRPAASSDGSESEPQLLGPIVSSPVVDGSNLPKEIEFTGRRKSKLDPTSTPPAQ